MRLNCEVEVLNRLLPSLNQRGKCRACRACLAVGVNGKNSDSPSAQILLSTAQNKTGTIYLVRKLSKIFDRFVDEGKATLRFDQPEVDIAIKSDVVQLKSFLSVVRSLKCEKKVHPSALSSLQNQKANFTATKTQKTKLIITNKIDYPVTKNFPYSLQTLQVNTCSLNRVDSRIIKLPYLRVLNLSQNSIRSLPSGFGTLKSLEELHLQQNQLTEFSDEILTPDAFPSLFLLNLSNNLLQDLSPRIDVLRKLVTLKLDSNRLSELPVSLGDVQSLKHLSASKNRLKFLPGNITNLKLDFVDFNGNPLMESMEENPRDGFVAPTLQEWAAKSILSSKIVIKEGILPKPLIRFLHTGIRCGWCKSYCFNCYQVGHCNIDLRNVAQTITYNQIGMGVYVPVEARLCSSNCLQHFLKRFGKNIK